MDLAPHDVDFIRWCMDDEVTEVYATGSSSTTQLARAHVYDNATMMLKFSLGAVCTIHMSRGSTYGYDQRCEIFGSNGLVQVGNELLHATTTHNIEGSQRSQLKHSFPQRFREAFEAEVDAFADVALNENAVWPVAVGDCVAAQEIAEAAQLSAAEHRTVYLSPSAGASVKVTVPTHKRLVVRPIGAGNFGTYMRSIVECTGASSRCAASAALPARINMLPAYTRSAERSGAMSWGNHVLEDSTVDAVYVCSPDSEHERHAYDCLQTGKKHVLIEKPVSNFANVIKAQSAGNGLVVMVGLQRRFDSNFLRCRDFVRENPTKFHSIVIESRDPVEADKDMAFVMRNSVCHDIDMLGFLFDFDEVITFTSGKSNPVNSAIELEANLVLKVSKKRKRNYTTNNHVLVKIIYSKCHESYLQKVTINTLDGKVHSFGYDYRNWKGTFCEVYAPAYAAQWSHFASLIQDGESAEESAERLSSYEKTFQCVEQAAEVLGL